MERAADRTPWEPPLTLWAICQMLTADDLAELRGAAMLEDCVELRYRLREKIGRSSGLRRAPLKRLEKEIRRLALNSSSPVALHVKQYAVT